MPYYFPALLYLDGNDKLFLLFPGEVDAAEFALAERLSYVKALERPVFLGRGGIFFALRRRRRRLRRQKRFRGADGRPRRRHRK